LVLSSAGERLHRAAFRSQGIGSTKFMASINTDKETPARLIGRSPRDAAGRRSALLSVTFVNSVQEFPAELGTDGFPAPLEGRWLYRVLEESGLEDQFTFLYALVYERDAPVAAAPLFVMDVPMERVCPEKLLRTLKAIARVLPSVLFQRTLFVGSPGAAQGVVGMRPDTNRRAVLVALQSSLEKKARDLKAELIIWRDMPESISRDLEWLATRSRLFRAVSLPSTIVRFPSARKDDYLAQLKASRRGALKRKLKRSAALVDITTEIVQQPAPFVLDEMFGLFRQTYLRARMKFEDLDRTWFEKISELPTTYFLFLREKRTGAMIAVTACFDGGSMLVARHVGFDYGKPRSWMLYFRLWDALVDWALSKGFTSILTGATSYSAKIETGHELIPLFNYIWHRNAVIHAIYRAVAQQLDWAKLDPGLAKFLKAHPGMESMMRPRHTAE
jgi:hypothetical protein